MKIFEVPTGHICIMDGELKKPLEFLSLGDYGKGKNIKADFLGYKKEISGVPHGDLLPLNEKWVITISTQYGCSMDCMFCDVPKVGKGINATTNDLINQVENAMSLHPEVTSGRINLHYARMGEPTWNDNVIESAVILQENLSPSFRFHPVVSTMMPRKNKELEPYITRWLHYKSEFGAGLQLSINTTDENVRNELFSGNALSLPEISDVMRIAIEYHAGVEGRKIALNFALTGDEIDAALLAKLFDPKYFMCKITPMHITNAVKENRIGNDDGYYSFTPYKQVEEDLIAAGFDVIVFIPSLEEDQSRITCGNAILSDFIP